MNYDCGRDAEQDGAACEQIQESLGSLSSLSQPAVSK